MKKGDLVGPYFGTVKAIKDSQVIVIEKLRDYLGNILENQRIIHFSGAHIIRKNNNL